MGNVEQHLWIYNKLTKPDSREGLEVQTEEENERQVCMEAKCEWKDEKRKDRWQNKYGNLK